MVQWTRRTDLSRENRLRRSVYEVLRDELDQYVMEYSLIRSYHSFRATKAPYPFVEKREMKPRARIPQIEYDKQNAFLILFVEDTLPSIYKKHIRFFDANKTTKANLEASKAVALGGSFDRKIKHLESVRFFSLLEKILPVDYALLIQRDPATKARNRYTLTHFHVRVDWPIADAAEDLGRSLRYISKDLYERGEAYAEDIQKKFFEYYGVPQMSGGRRTAAIVAAQFLRRIPCVSTVYVGSSESRALVRIGESDIQKIVLKRLSEEQMGMVAEAREMKISTFRKNYLVGREGGMGVVLFRATYEPTIHSIPPEDGKLRDLKPEMHWISVQGQHVLPKPGVLKFAPLSCNLIYN